METTETMENVHRGAFIVFEGCDKSGKTTQSKSIVKLLESQGIPAKYMSFPARHTLIGSIIDKYLSRKHELSNEGIHLLFSANRWELQNEMKKTLESGTTLIVDRYSYSGVAYSAAKGLCYEWCKAPEKGLLRPDLVIYLKVPVNELSRRDDFGSERYEILEFQKKVDSVFNRVYKEEKDYWNEVNARENRDDLHIDLSIKITETIKNVGKKPFKYLW